MTETCTECGTSYHVTYVGMVPARDEDKLFCECGHLIRKWNDRDVRKFEKIVDAPEEA